MPPIIIPSTIRSYNTPGITADGTGPLPEFAMASQPLSSATEDAIFKKLAELESGQVKLENGQVQIKKELLEKFESGQVQIKKELLEKLESEKMELVYGQVQIKKEVLEKLESEKMELQAEMQRMRESMSIMGTHCSLLHGRVFSTEVREDMGNISQKVFGVRMSVLEIGQLPPQKLKLMKDELRKANLDWFLAAPVEMSEFLDYIVKNGNAAAHPAMIRSDRDWFNHLVTMFVNSTNMSREIRPSFTGAIDLAWKVRVERRHEASSSPDSTGSQAALVPSRLSLGASSSSGTAASRVPFSFTPVAAPPPDSPPNSPRLSGRKRPRADERQPKSQQSKKHKTE